MKKKALIMCTCLVMGLTCAGCGKSDADKTEETTTAAATTAIDTSSNINGVTIDETVLVDENGIKMTAKSLGEYKTEDYWAEYALNVEVQNTTDKTVMVGYNHSSVNSYMVQIDLSMEVAPGETKNVPAIFNEAEMENCGIETIADMEFDITVSDSATGEMLVETDPLTIRTSASETYVYSYDESGTVAYDKNGIKIVVQEPVVDDFFGPQVKIYVANTTDDEITVTTDSAEINGIKKDVFFAVDPFAGKRAVGLLGPYSDEQMSQPIKSFKGSFSIFNSQTGELIEEKTEPVEVKFE